MCSLLLRYGVFTQARPIAVIKGVTRRGNSIAKLVALWTPFDNPKSGLGSRERHVVGNYRLGKAPEAERANLFGYDASP
jgi:hypothetical protein